MQNVIGTDNPLVLPSEPVPPDELRDYLARVEEASREGVDAAVRAFSRSGSWQESSASSVSSWHSYVSQALFSGENFSIETAIRRCGSSLT